MLPSLGVFSLAGSFRCLFLLLFLGALYVAWVLFYVGLFSVRTVCGVGADDIAGKSSGDVSILKRAKELF